MIYINQILGEESKVFFPRSDGMLAVMLALSEGGKVGGHSSCTEALVFHFTAGFQRGQRHLSHKDRL